MAVSQAVTNRSAECWNNRRQGCPGANATASPDAAPVRTQQLHQMPARRIRFKARVDKDKEEDKDRSDFPDL